MVYRDNVAWIIEAIEVVGQLEASHQNQVPAQKETVQKDTLIISIESIYYVFGFTVASLIALGII